MSAEKRKMLSPISILMIVIILAAFTTWVMPAGQFAKLSKTDSNAFSINNNGNIKELPFTQHTLDSLAILIPLEKFTNGDIRKPISIPGTYTPTEKNKQGFLQILQAPIKGIYDSIDIVFFILIIGGFMFVFNETGAMLKGVNYLSHRMKGKEINLIIILTIVFSFFGSSYGMAEEALVFFPILVPIFLAAGFDLLVPLAILFGGTSVGNLSSFSNAFSTIIASNAAGINWMDGFLERVIMFVISTSLLAFFIVRYAKKIKKNPEASLVLKYDGVVPSPYELHIQNENSIPALDWKTKLLLGIYISTFLTMIAGVIFLDWWTLEMSVLFLASSLLIAVIAKMNEDKFTTEFIKGAQSLLSTAFIVGIARGVTLVLNEGKVSDAILYYASGVVQGVPAPIFIVLLLGFYFIFSLFISSSSGMAVLTMPIIGSLAIIINIPGREIVNSYLFGINLMSLLSPTGLLLPCLALVNVSIKTWYKFISPLLLLLTIICILFLIVGIYL